MKYEQLAEFIDKKVRMSHIYQPVMLMTLVAHGGRCPEREIAKALLAHDESEIEYYSEITNNMVGRVLRNHEVVSRDKANKSYQLNDYDNLTPQQKDALIALCEKRLNAFVEARGRAIYDHRRLSVGYIPGTLKYDVLKRARFRCELCGISADEKALEVDHILPRNHGGSDDLTNFQALCYSCNAMKRNRDDTDFRKIRESYDERERGCLFFEINKERGIAENELAYAIGDGFPVSPLHTLVIPKRHTATYFELSQAEINACTYLIKDQKQSIETQDRSVDGFNIGINNGSSAGQTIFHCHVHLIPRRSGDVENPRGGVRHTMLGKRYYGT